MSLTDKNICDKCCVRVPKNRPKIVCTLCNIAKHYRCQSLSRADAEYIIRHPTYEWMCGDCFADILPVNACVVNNKPRKNMVTVSRFKQKCMSCGGQSYSPRNIGACVWCGELCHNKCLNGDLGCNRCCEAMIPGFHVHNHELFGTTGRNNNSIFNPYSPSHMSNLIGDTIAREEESNPMWSEISEFLLSCQYRQLKNVRMSNNNELNVLSLNIRSLAKNISVIADNIVDYQKYDVMCFNETNCNIDKLANGLNDLIIEGFHPPIIQAPVRSTCKGGGLAIYVNCKMCSPDQIEPVNLRLSEPSSDGEFLFVKISECKNVRKSVIIGNVYRSPSRQPNKFNELLETVLQRLNRHSNKHILLTGDFNIDLIKHDTDINSQNLIDTTGNHGFVQIISRPTRITDHSATLIDHVYTNKVSSVISSSVVTLDLSDHLATHATISLDTNSDINTYRHTNGNNSEPCEFRMFNAANDAKFRELIADEDWDIPDDSDAQSQYDSFLHIYTKHYNTAYPLTTKRTRRKHERVLPKAWILPWLEDACNRKDNLYHEWVKDPTTANEIVYKKMKKFIEKHIKIAKSKYYKSYFEQYSDNSKKQWKMINSLLNRTTKKSPITKLQDSNGEVINTPLRIAEKFNEYFANIASNLKSNSRNMRPPDEFENYLKNPVTNSMYVKSVDSGEIFNIINKLKNKATLDTKISPLKIANTDPKFTEALAKVINSSFKQGVFPNELKTARVVPIFKSGVKTDVSNYRPISLLSSFSKIYEKLMHHRIVEFLELNNTLHDMQYGFRAGRSCEHALLMAQSTLLESMNKKQISLLLFIDFSKAFDMVDHSILLKKLHHYGIRGVAWNWMKSYLENRKQFVTIGGTDSSTKTMAYGVPQGSILGPLLFVIYINDIPGICNFAKFILYADDANIILTGDCMSQIEEQLAQLSVNLVKWVDCNGLALNLKKTNYMIFTRQKMNNFRDVYIAGTLIQRKSEAKFLGVIVDDKLTWSQHIRSIKSKMSRHVGIMFKIKRFLPVQARMQIFHSFVQSHINFCSLVWGFSSKSNIESLFMSQKKGMRAVMSGFINYFYKDGNLPSHTKSGFCKHGVLTIHGIIALNTLTFMHKVFSFPNLLPPSVRNTIATNAPRDKNSDHVTCKEWLEHYGTHIFNKSIFYKGPLIFINKFSAQPMTHTSILSVKAFKTNMKREILKVQGAGDPIEWEVENFMTYNIAGLRKSARTK